MTLENASGLLNKVIWDNTIQDYVQALITLVGLLFIFVFTKKLVVNYLGKIAKRTANNFDDLCVQLISQIDMSIFLVVAVYLTSLSLELSGTIRSLIHYGTVIILTIRAVLFLEEVLKYGITKVYRRRLDKDDGSLEPMVASITGVLKWCIWTAGVLFVLDNMGINITTVVAGIGIGGIAVAIASQAVLGDAFSALSIFLDKPFEIGDFVYIDENYLGTVEHIGIKTTRIRSLFGEQLVLANSDLTKSRLKNYKRMQTRRIAFTVAVAYDTPLDKIKKIPDIVKGIFHVLPQVRLDRAHFNNFGTAGLNFEVVYFVNSPDYNLYMDYQQKINFALMERFEEEAILFAHSPLEFLPAKT